MRYKLMNDGSCIEVEDKEYRQKIEDEVWDFVYMLFNTNLGQLNKCFGTASLNEILTSLSYSQAKSQYDNWVDNNYKEKVIALANEIGIHKLYALVKEIRGE